MSPKGVFRLMVLASVTLALVGGVGELAFSAHLPAPLQEWERSEAEREPTAGEMAVAIAGGVFIIAGVICTVGLLMFWRPARPLSVALTVLGLPLTAALGPSVWLGWVSAVSDLTATLSGATLAMAYCWSPVRALFGDPPPERTPTS